MRWEDELNERYRKGVIAGREEGREEERQNTEKERQNAERERMRAEAAEKRIAELEALLGHRLSE